MSYVTDINELDPNGHYSYADYLKWRFDDVVELFRGKLMRMSPAPLRQHQDIVLNISSRIKFYLRKKDCKVYIAPFDVRLPNKPGASEEQTFTVVQPDICIICDPAKLDRRGCVGAPDTVIEILSKGNIDRDVKQKFDLYAEHGVPEYWIVIPGVQTISVYTLDDAGQYRLDGEYTDPGEVPVRSLPGYTLLWEEVFE